MPVKVLFTCGGTAGHINPAVALAGMFAQRMDAEILFVGADGGMETRLVPKEGYALKTVTITSFYRSFSGAAIKHNLTTLRNLSRSKAQARAILDEFQPDLVVGTGGYASYPVVREAARRGIPTAVHESNAEPGLTTKMLAKCVDKVMVGFEESRKHYPHPERVEITGTPVRGEFFARTRQQAREELGFADEKPLVVTSWGSLGAKVMNDHMVNFVARECKEGTPFHHIYGVGTRYYNHVIEALKEKGIDLADYPMVDVREYIYNMPVVMAAADVMLSRAGASTISELTAIAKPAVLVPSPNVTANHQEKNARVLSDRGAAVLMLENQSSGDKLYETVQSMLADEAGLEKMRTQLQEMSIGDANERIYQVLCSIMKK
jgi:UDP-N-acetylglucosamine--N-acetylmuramyl-(pentapeptide) pyrophosphoryl-undecaprenol N-acetylglucosamine transferase